MKVLCPLLSGKLRLVAGVSKCVTGICTVGMYRGASPRAVDAGYPPSAWACVRQATRPSQFPASVGKFADKWILSGAAVPPRVFLCVYSVAGVVSRPVLDVVVVRASLGSVLRLQVTAALGVQGHGSCRSFKDPCPFGCSFWDFFGCAHRINVAILPHLAELPVGGAGFGCTDISYSACSSLERGLDVVVVRASLVSGLQSQESRIPQLPSKG
jgi:hypothetical protein